MGTTRSVENAAKAGPSDVGLARRHGGSVGCRRERRRTQGVLAGVVRSGTNVGAITVAFRIPREAARRDLAGIPGHVVSSGRRAVVPMSIGAIERTDGGAVAEAVSAVLIEAVGSFLLEPVAPREAVVLARLRIMPRGVLPFRFGAQPL